MRDLAGLKVLLVEDEAGVALLLEDMLQDLGCEVAASVAHLSKACDVARTGGFDVAVIDVNLDGEPAFPLAALLRERKVPFVFSTGYGAVGLPPEFKDLPLLGKPFLIEDLRRGLAAALAQTSTR